MKLWNHIKKAISAVLVLAMVSQTTVVAYGQDHSGTTYSGGSIVQSEEQTSGDPYVQGDILVEVESRREEYTKHFALSDGNLLAVQYGIPVHFKDADGNWTQYDNRMEETTALLGEATDASMVSEYRVIQSDKDIRLAKKADKKKLVTISKDGYEISWGFADVNKSAVEFTEPDAPTDENDAHLNLTGVMQEAWYRDVYPGVDLQYLVMPMGVKENIVLKSADAQNEFVMEYKFKKLTAVQTDEQTIELHNEDGEVVYTITAPLMQDANGQTGNALTLSIVEQKNNKLQVKLTADAGWLQAEDRAYPVVVDPSFETSQSWGVVDSTTLVSGYPTTSFGKGGDNYQGSLYAGYEDSSWKKTRAMVRLNTLPQLSPGDMVVNAQMALLQYRSAGAVQVNVHRVTADWAMSTATWNNASSKYEATVADYEVSVSCNDFEYHYNTWDITRLVKDWYDDPDSNHGVMLIAPKETNTSMTRVVYFASTYPASVTVRPLFQITYRNNKGLESYWTYHEQSLSSGAVGYINDYSGNMVYQVPVMSESGSRLPVSITLTYNAYTANQQFLGGSSGLVTGNGWQLDWGQRCWRTDQLPGLSSDVATALQEAGYKRIYIDGDGTVHYFKTTTSDYVLEDEDGLGMTMKVNSDPASPYLIECADGTELHFTVYGYIYKIQDANGNIAAVEYDNVYMKEIMDGAGRDTMLTYETSGSYKRLTSVTDPSGRTTTLTYDSNGNLTKVSYADGTWVEFTYAATSINGKTYYLIQRATGSDGVYMEYIYNTDTDGVDALKARVTSVKEYATIKLDDDTTQTELGNSLNISYSNDNTTTFTYTVGDKTTEQEFQFDNFGRTVCVRNDDGSFAQSKYTSTTGKTNNRLTQSASGEKYVNNLLLDHSAERNNGKWTASGSNTTFAVDTAQHFLGYNSFKVSRSGKDGKSGYYQEVAVTADESYTFSAYVRTDNVQIDDDPDDDTSHWGAGLYAMFYDASGAVISDSEGNTIVVRSFASTGTSDWTREQLTFTVPEDAVKVRVYCGLMEASGTAWFDCLQLETGRAMNDYNMIETSSFERLGSWTGANHGTGGTKPAYGYYMLTGDIATNKSGYQRIYINREAPVSFTFSAQATGQSAPVGYDGRRYGLSMGIFYEDGSESWHSTNFNPDTSAPQRASMTTTIPEEHREKLVKYVIFYVTYYKNVNTVYFDDCMVTFDETGTAYTYDSEGNLISSIDNANRNGTYSYNDANELTGYTNQKNESYDYIYASGNKHQLIAARSDKLGNGFTYTYDDRGNIIGTSMGKVSEAGVLSTSDPYLQTSTTYNASKNYVISETDQRGNTISYSISDVNGLVNSITDAKGYVTNYTYNSSSFLPLTVTSGNASVSYTYDSNLRLKSITHNGFNYNFLYDKFGNTSSIAIGNRNLITHTYGDNNGLLLSSKYGNGTVRGYLYDNYGRVIGETVNGTQKYELIYNAKGQISELKDLANDRQTLYTYDVTGRLLRAFQPGISDIFTSYDVMNRVTATTYKFGKDSKTVSFNYGADGRKADSTLLSGATRITKYDVLSRETKMTIGNLFRGEEQSTGSLIRNIAYLSANEPEAPNRTTTLPSSMTYQYRVGEENTTALFASSYTYDDLGNISTMTVDGVTYTYTYDALNQLTGITVGNDSGNSYTATYTYDNGGNILTKTINGTKYVYGYDDNWKDLLDTYRLETDGETVGKITYDAIGNPIQYRDGMTMSWTGRQLNSIVKNGTTNAYTYNTDGIRIRKTVGNTTTEYFTNGSTILAEKTGNNIIWYIYDSDGDLLGFTYNGTPYYYIKNMQGDVYKVVNNNGQVVASYAYDAWGKVLTATGTMAVINPIRYRGYYYDTETGLYYLNSRYYDPETGRFINADAQVNTDSIIGHNLFAYCDNNPVNKFDPTGHVGLLAATLFKATAVVAASIGAALATVAIVGAIVLATVMVCVAVQKTADAVKSTVETLEKITQYEDQNVYVLTDPADNDAIKYVGRTNDPVRRLNEHRNDKNHRERKEYNMTVIATGLTIPEAKVAEQVLISAYTMVCLENARREIAVGNLKGYSKSIKAVIRIFNSVTEDELTNLMGR